MTQKNAGAAAPADQPPQFVILPLELFNAVGEYLTSRPFKEVDGLVNALRQGARLVSPDAPAPQAEVGGPAPIPQPEE